MQCECKHSSGSGWIAWILGYLLFFHTAFIIVVPVIVIGFIVFALWDYVESQKVSKEIQQKINSQPRTLSDKRAVEYKGNIESLSWRGKGGVERLRSRAVREISEKKTEMNEKEREIEWEKLKEEFRIKWQERLRLKELVNQMMDQEKRKTEVESREIAGRRQDFRETYLMD